MKRKLISKKNIISVAIIAVLYILIQVLINGGYLSRQMMSVIIPLCYNVIMAVSLSLIVGVLGELSLGHAAFMSIGAYSSALFTTKFELPEFIALPLALIIGGLCAAALGFIIGIPVLRLKGDYLAIVTLGFGEIIKSIFNFLPITGGSKGLSGIPIYTSYRNFGLVFLITAVIVLLIKNLLDSRHGRVFAAIRDNSIAAQATGIPVGTYKTMAFVIAAFFAGIAGVLYAHNVGILKPGNFDYNMSIEILVMVVLGGMGSIGGSIIAAVILTLLPELLRSFADYRMLLYAIVLIALMLFNNSSLKKKLIEKRQMSRQEKSEKEGE
ncbi:branched-chain amino acid ABC transporter permease [Scatolibacter rhodanostii]|uniref:branched-chain amino acid ABC transporter permease n=1 Tax=Scatolibacter rhodanostii TaxID=2014781 RepID=UPI000C089214|nr:branched-chain amino acid ABC transporter permease [Scatolibacter rhodanostii]